MADHTLELPNRRLDGIANVVAPFLPALVGMALVGLVALVAAPAAVVSDTWLALVSGREIVQHGLPSHDHLTVLARDRRWVDQEWLGQLALYGVWRIGGLGGVSAFATGTVLFAYGLPTVAAARTAVNPSIPVFLPLLAIGAGAFALQPRPQTLALAAYSLVLYLLLTDLAGTRRRTFLVFPILAVWANVHGSVVLGALLVVIYALCLLARSVRRRAILFLAAPACVFASPYALSLPHYYRAMLLDPPFRRLGIAPEWQPAGVSALFAGFYLLVAVAILVVARRRSRIAMFELLVLVVTAAGGFFALRNTVWFALAALFVLPRVSTSSEKLKPRMSKPLALALAVVTALGVLVAVDRQSSSASPRGLTARAAAAVGASVKRTGGAIFADTRHADWLLWKVPSARGRVAYDARLELLTSSQLAEIGPIIRHGAASPLIHSYTFAVLSPRQAVALERSGWGRITYEDRSTALVLRSTDGRRR